MKFTNLLIALALVCPVAFFAQSFQKFYGTSGSDILGKMISDQQGHFFATGTKKSGDHSATWLMKLDTSGSLLWEKTIEPLETGHSGYGLGLTFLPDGGLLVTGKEFGSSTYDGEATAIRVDSTGTVLWQKGYLNVLSLTDAVAKGTHFLAVGDGTSFGSSQNAIVLELDAAGTLVWKNEFSLYSDTYARRVLPTADGKYLIIGRTNVIGQGFAGVLLRKIKPDGSAVWQTYAHTDYRDNSTYADNSHPYFQDPMGGLIAPDGTIWVTNPDGYSSNIALLHFTSKGQLLKHRTYPRKSLGDRPTELLLLPAGKFLIAGTCRTLPITPANYQGFVAMVDTSGFEYWRHYYGADNTENRFASAALLPNGGYLLAGTSNDTKAGSHGDHDGWIVGARPDGTALPWKVQVRVVVDLNGDCTAGPNEPAKPGWVLTVKDSLTTRNFITAADGTVVFYTRDGTLDLHIWPLDSARWTICNNDQVVHCNALIPANQITFLARPNDNSCSFPEVHITQPDLSRCQTSAFYATIRNQGGGISEPLEMHLTLEPELTLINASMAYTANGAGFDFLLPALPGYQDTTIRIDAKLVCTAQLGATYGIRASLSAAGCSPQWNGPRFAVTGHCTGNLVEFNLNNNGGSNGGTSTTYRVIADNLLVLDNTPVDLPAGGAGETFAFPADGRTWRVEVDQPPGFPGNQLATASVERCGTTQNGLPSIGFKSGWHTLSEKPAYATAEAPVTTVVPDKVAAAQAGFGYYHMMGDAGPLEFTVRVRNPLTVPGHEVSFRLLPSDNLDIRTFQPVAWSAPFELELEESGSIRVRMPNMQLDTGYGPGAYAMIRFRITPTFHTLPDSGHYNYVQVLAAGYVNKVGPIDIPLGYYNYTHGFLSEDDPNYTYLPEILTYGGIGYTFGTCMAGAPDGSVFLAGSSFSYSDQTSYDGLIIKTDKIGKAIWLNAFDTGDRGYGSFYGITALPDGGCIAVGSYLPGDAPLDEIAYYYAYVVRLDAAGKLLWSKKYRPAGTKYGTYGYGILSTLDDNFFIYGLTQNNVLGQTAPEQFYLKIDLDGNEIWNANMFVGGFRSNPVMAIAAPNGDIIVVGSQLDQTDSRNVFLERINQQGKILWSNGFTTQSPAAPAGIAPVSGGGYLIGLNTANAPAFLKVNEAGEWIWEHYEPAPWGNQYSSIRDMIASPDGNYLCTGLLKNDTIGQQYDVLLFKVDPDGHMLWDKHYGGLNTEWAEAILVSPQADKVLLWGYNQRRLPLGVIQGVLVRTDLNGNLSTGTDPEPVQTLPDVVVYPNPASSLVWVSIKPDPVETISWVLYTTDGRVAASGRTSAPVFNFDVSRLEGGLYVLKFPDTNLKPKRLAIVHR